MPEFADVSGTTYLSAQDVSGRRIERHGGTIGKVLFYRLDTKQGRRWLLVHLTSDDLITDYDIVEKSPATSSERC